MQQKFVRKYAEWVAEHKQSFRIPEDIGFCELIGFANLTFNNVPRRQIVNGFTVMDLDLTENIERELLMVEYMQRLLMSGRTRISVHVLLSQDII